MALSQRRAQRKTSGGRYRKDRKKQLKELGAQPTHTRIGEKKSKMRRGAGGVIKQSLLKSDTLNLYLPKEKKYVQEKIKTVVENPANRNFIRRNILTKGSVVETSFGKAKIRSRPGQEGVLNAVLVEEKK